MSARETPASAGGELKHRVYAIVATIPTGRVAAYSFVATLAGSPRAARVVGGILRNSSFEACDLPWHRVINAAGRISFGGDVGRSQLQRELLEAEGVVFGKDDSIDWAECGWDGSGAPRYWSDSAPEFGHWESPGHRSRR